MGNAYIRAIFIHVTNIYLIFTITQKLKIAQLSFLSFILLSNSDGWHHWLLVTKPNIDFRHMCKYPLKCNFLATGLYIICESKNLRHILEFGSKKNIFTINLIIFHKWVRVKMRYMLVTWMKMAPI